MNKRTSGTKSAENDWGNESFDSTASLVLSMRELSPCAAASYRRSHVQGVYQSQSLLWVAKYLMPVPKHKRRELCGKQSSAESIPSQDEEG